MIGINKKIMVHAYKRNGWLYRIWEFPKIVDINSNYICVSLYNSRVITSDKDSNRYFHSKNLKNSFWFFFKEEWFNIIATLNDNDTINCYVNIASPFIYEEEAIKYYDFDLDIKMRSNAPETYKILDEDEFNENKIQFNYENKVIDRAIKELERFKNDEFRKQIFKKINVDLLKKYMKNK